MDLWHFAEKLQGAQEYCLQKTSIKIVFGKALQNFLKRFSLKKIPFVLNNSYTNTNNTGV